MKRTRRLALLLALTSLSTGAMTAPAQAAKPMSVSQARAYALTILQREVVRSQQGLPLLVDQRAPNGRFSVPGPASGNARHPKFLDLQKVPDSCNAQVARLCPRARSHTLSFGIERAFCASGAEGCHAEPNWIVVGDIKVSRSRSGRLTHLYTRHEADVEIPGVTP